MLSCSITVRTIPAPSSSFPARSEQFSDGKIDQLSKWLDLAESLLGSNCQGMAELEGDRQTPVGNPLGSRSL